MSEKMMKSDIIKSIDNKLSGLRKDDMSFTIDELNVIHELVNLKTLDPNKIETPITNEGHLEYDDKAKYLTQKSKNGHCYILLLRSLPAYLDCTLDRLMIAVESMIQQLKQSPDGCNVPTELTICNRILETGVGLTFESFDPNYHTSVLSSVLESNTRFKWQTNNDNEMLCHIELPDWDGCECSRIMCPHGWATRFVICAITLGDRRIGSTLNLDDLFMNDSNDKPLFEHSSGQTTPIQKINSNFNAQYHRMMNKPDVEQFNVRYLDNKSKLIEKIENQEDLIQSLATEIETLRPIDSSSQADRYERKFMTRQDIESMGLVSGRKQIKESSDDYHTEKKNKRTQPTSKVIRPSTFDITGKKLALNEEDILAPIDVTKGYMKTHEMYKKELSSINQIPVINGLSKPFQNSRLNLLAHFFSAMDTMKLMDNNDYISTILNISKYQSKDPSEELAYQMIVRTFDVKDMVVIANPFKFPYVEIGMRMSSSNVLKAIDSLIMEYQSLWFSEFKSIKVPQFHSKYSSKSFYPSKSKVKTKSRKTSSSVLSLVK